MDVIIIRWCVSTVSWVMCATRYVRVGCTANTPRNEERLKWRYPREKIMLFVVEKVRYAATFLRDICCCFHGNICEAWLSKQPTFIYHIIIEKIYNSYQCKENAQNSKYACAHYAPWKQRLLMWHRYSFYVNNSNHWLLLSALCNAQANLPSWSKTISNIF